MLLGEPPSQKTLLGRSWAGSHNAYRVHEPSHRLGAIAMTLFVTESNNLTPSATELTAKRGEGVLRRAPCLLPVRGAT